MLAVRLPGGSQTSGVVGRAASVLDETVGSSVQMSEAMLMMGTPLVSPSPLGFVGYGRRDDTR
jgi:hypothetical protein